MLTGFRSASDWLFGTSLISRGVSSAIRTCAQGAGRGGGRGTSGRAGGSRLWPRFWRSTAIVRADFCRFWSRWIQALRMLETASKMLVTIE